MKIEKKLESETGQNIAGKLGGFDEVAQGLAEIYDSDNTVRHNGETYDVTEDAALAYLSEYFEDPEDRLSDLKDAEKNPEEIFDSLTDNVKIETDLSSPSRREVLGYTGALATATYAIDAYANHKALENAGQDDFEVPSSTLYKAAVAEGPLEDDPIPLTIMNFGEEYDEEAVLSNLDSAVSELDGLEVEPQFIQVEPSLEGYLEAQDTTRDQLGKDGVNTVKNRATKMRNIIQNNKLLGDEVSPRNQVEVGGAQNPSSVEENMDWYSSMFIPSVDTSPLSRLKLVNADFVDAGDFNGAAYHDSDGYNNMSLLDDSKFENADEFSGILIHELGHLLGLPHTQYPDTESGQVFPDVMSYSEGNLNMPYQVSQVITGERAFGWASRQNWEEVKDYVEENRRTYVDD